MTVLFPLSVDALVFDPPENIITSTDNFSLRLSYVSSFTRV